MENRMLRVRNEAKNNVRRFIDDISFVVTKESRDRLQAVHRQLRDHYRGIANQTTRSINESLQAMLMSARMEETERNQRIAELERQLNILRQVSAKAAELASAPKPSAASTSTPQPRVTIR
jgi:polyhydroxyalkanoate synthesis regulator phasin